MFKLIRRISYSVIPRPDRPWEEDPTSNAPTRRKRRISSTEPETSNELEQQQGKKKKIRADSELSQDNLDNDHPTTIATPEVSAGNDEDATQREGSVEVKSVTKGVKDVELDDKPNLTEQPTTTAENSPENTADEATGVESSAASVTQEGDIVAVHPESIPLPEEDDESDDLASSSSPSPTKEEEEEEDSVASTDETTTSTTPVEVSSHEAVTEESTNTSPSSPGKRPHTRTSASPRKLPSQSPQKLFTTV